MTTLLVAPPRLELLQATQDHAAVTSYETSPPPSQEMDEDAEDFGPQTRVSRLHVLRESRTPLTWRDFGKSLQREPSTERNSTHRASPIPTTSRKERVTLGTHVPTDGISRGVIHGCKPNEPTAKLLEALYTDRVDVLTARPMGSKANMDPACTSRNQSPPNSSLAHPPPERPPDLLQWNCRSQRQSATELVELFRLTGRPAALLLQETRGTSPGISGFNGYFQPTIEHGLRGGSSDTSQTIEAQAAVFVRKGLPQAQIATTAYCNPFQEVVAVRCTLGRHREAAELAHLTLANDLDYPTRHGLHEGQRDTTPDLTWADSRLVTDWRCGPDPMGSDHYPIWLELSTGGKPGRRRLTRLSTGTPSGRRWPRAKTRFP
ncbi:hypothetical protein HPB47_012789 [Ixodes persulcatus]|uniref:Uncharacterized protein n=1 Tax=Ixodes persulcatus TaxID=34615 RepID=A0AC60NSH4_IXOPE|nr:hypothetical protein HPB47_012789 [Ixodes persulcatus]